MADKKIPRESLKETRKRLDIEERISKILQEETKDISTYLSFQRKLQESKKSQLDLENEIKKSLKKGRDNLTISQKEELERNLILRKAQKEYNELLTDQLGGQHLINAALGSTLGLINEMSGLDLKREIGAGNILKWIIEQDKYTKQLNLSLGVSGKRADIMAQSMRDTVSQTQVLGVGLEQLTDIYSSLSKETGRVRLYTVQQQKAIAEISSGLKLSTQQTGELVGMYENIGISLIGTHERMSELTDMSERYGVNVSNVMESILKNFKSAQKFYFKGGVASIEKMAVFAEKWKLSMESTFQAMEKNRTLEGSVENMMQLKLLGGEFAKSNVFTMLYQARNDGEAFQKTIANMTKGTAFFNKELNQFQVSAVGMDVLRQAAETLGIPLEELKETSIRMSEINMMQKSIPGFARANEEYKNLIEGQAKWNKETKTFQITDPFGLKKAIDIKNISKLELDAFKAGQLSLEKRALAAQDFSTVMLNSINTIKSAFLPILKGIQPILEGLQSITKWLGENKWAVWTGAAIIGLTKMSSLLLGPGFSLLVPLTNKLTGFGKSFGSLFKIAEKTGKGGLMGSIFGGMSPAGMLKGALALGAVGASLIPFAYAMKLMGEATDKGKSFLALAGGLTVMTGAVIALGAAMATGFGAAGLALGVGAIAAMGASVLPLAYAMKTLGEANMSDIGFGFKTISSSVNTIDSKKLEEIRLTAEALKGLSVNSDVFSQLKNIFGDGVEVKFKDNQVAINVDITTEIDGSVLARKTARTFAEVEYENNYYKT